MFKQREQVTGVAFYCKDCERIVTTRQIGRKYVYSCDICKTKNVAFGTEKSIRSYFKFDEMPPSAPVAATGSTPTAPVVPPTIPSAS